MGEQALKHLAEGHALVLFDGPCALCNAFVRFVALRDPGSVHRFAALQSGVASDLARRRSLPPFRDTTVVLLTSGGHFEKSEAVLRIAANLAWPWRALAGLRVLPRGMRDFVYDYVAARRRRWFGTTDACPIPEPGLVERLLVDEERTRTPGG